LFQDPTSCSPSISRHELIFIYPSLLMGMNIFLGYT
jgi:hypothetical protein